VNVAIAGKYNETINNSQRYATLAIWSNPRDTHVDLNGRMTTGEGQDFVPVLVWVRAQNHAVVPELIEGC